MNNFLNWLEKERGEYAPDVVLGIFSILGFVVLCFLVTFLIYITGGWIILAVLIAPAWVAWMFFCYITRERDQ